MASDLSTWRKKYREPGQSRSMTTDTASAIVGLSKQGYNNQVAGVRPISKQTRLLMEAWDLMNDEQRAVFLELARHLRDGGKIRPTAAPCPTCGAEARIHRFDLI